jgi:hypothetical protein
LLAPAEPPPIVVGAQRTDIIAAPADYAERFRRDRFLALEKLFDPTLLSILLGSCARSTYVDDQVARLGTREIEAPQRIGGAMNLLLSRPPFLRWIEAVTGCGNLGRAEGRLVQTRASHGDQLEWHDDMNDEDRRLGITISLTDVPFEGGEFEMRDTDSGRLLARHRHREAGSALIFEIGRHLEHRLLPIAAGGPRRVFAGWFLRG